MIQRQRSISVYTSTLIFSVLLLLGSATTAHAQLKMFRVDNDSIPLFRGFAVSFDLVGPAMLALGDYGTYEGALRINLHDQWFPIFEMGIGRANHNDDENTHITYKTTAPFFRIGMDWNIMRNKHAANRLYAGFRYAFTSYKVDITRDNLPDPEMLDALAGSCVRTGRQDIRSAASGVDGALQTAYCPQRRYAGCNVVCTRFRQERQRRLRS